MKLVILFCSVSTTLFVETLYGHVLWEEATSVVTARTIVSVLWNILYWKLSLKISPCELPKYVVRSLVITEFVGLHSKIRYLFLITLFVTLLLEGNAAFAGS